MVSTIWILLLLALLAANLPWFSERLFYRYPAVAAMWDLIRDSLDEVIRY